MFLIQQKGHNYLTPPNRLCITGLVFSMIRQKLKCKQMGLKDILDAKATLHGWNL